MDTARDTSPATTQLVLGFLRDRGGDSAVAEVLGRAGLQVDAETLESTWISYDQRIRLFAATAEVLGDPEVMFEIGASALRSSVNPALVLVLRALGSPLDVFAQLPRAVPKFTATSTMRMVEVGASHAVIDYRLYDGYEHSRLDCAYAQGLLTVVPEIFGLPPASIVHERCQSDGHPSCVYEVAWTLRSRWPRRRRRATRLALDGEVKSLREQLGALQSAASDLVSGDDLQTVLQRIADRMASAIIAQGYLLAVEDPYGGALRVHWSGMDDERANRLASRLVAGDELGPSAVVVDVASARRHHGRLAAVYPEGQRGPAAERLLLEAYAGHAAAALDTILALEDARRGEERANALLRLATALAHAHTTAEVTQIVASALPGIAGTSRASILLWDAESGQLIPAARAAAGNGDDGAFWRFVATPQDSPTLARLLRLPRPFVVRLEEAEPVVRDVLRALGGGDIAITPMLSDGRLLGVLTTDWAGRDDTPEFFELAARLEGVASQAVPALLNAELVAKVRHQSLHDGLTALPNRRLLGDRASDAGHGRGPVAMLFCDLDRFKTINDTLGHTAGDELLRQVAIRLTACVRDGDTVARLSGDEFAILLPSVSNPGEAHDVADRVVASLARPFLIEGHELTVTASVGVAFDATGDEDPEDLLRSADEAMYEAKRRGRNQVAQLAGQSS